VSDGNISQSVNAKNYNPVHGRSAKCLFFSVESTWNGFSSNSRVVAPK